MFNRAFVRTSLSIGFLATFCIAMAVNALASTGNNFLFEKATGQISTMYPTLVTPASWAFAIWGLIYFFVATWLVYIGSLFCRTDGVHRPMYLTAPATNPFFLTMIILNLVLNMVWLGLFAAEHMVAACVVIFMLLAVTWAAVLNNYALIFKDGADLQRNFKVDLWIYRILFQNGLEAYGAWLLVASLLNLTICLQYVELITPRNAALAGLVTLLVLLLVLFPLENFVPRFEEMCRYGCLHYAVFAFAMSAIYARLMDLGDLVLDQSDEVIKIYAATMIALSGGLFVVRVALIVHRHRNRPLYSTL